MLLEDDAGRTLTAAEWRDASLRLAAALHDLGVSRGTTVSWQLPTIHESAILVMALARLGAARCGPELDHPTSCASSERETSVSSDRVVTSGSRDRIKDIIIRNAENLSALEIEAAVLQPSEGSRRCRDRSS